MLDRKAGARPQSAHAYLALFFVAVITFLTTGKECFRLFEEGAEMPLITNNAASKIAVSIGPTDGAISLQAGTGSLFPAPSGDWFPITLLKATGEFEIVHCTSRSADVLTVTRGREGTTGKTFSAGDRVELRLTAQTIEEMLMSVVPAGTGPLPWSLPAEPDGWIFCDARILLPATPYQKLRGLYIAAGFQWGQDGSGNPMIPDARGRAIAGIDGGTGRLAGGTIGAALGAQTHTLTAAQLAGHSHTITDPGHAHSVYDPGHGHGVYDPGHSHLMFTQAGPWGSVYDPDFYDAGISSNNYGAKSTRSSGANISIYVAGSNVGVNSAGTGVSAQSAGGGEAHNNVQPTLITNMIIKT